MTLGRIAGTALIMSLSAALPKAASAKETLVVSDPQDAGGGTLLLEQAIVDELRHSSSAAAISLDDALLFMARGPNKEMQQLEAMLQAARAQFDNLEPDLALKQYTKALGKLEKAILGSDQFRPLTDALAMVSAVYLLLGQEKKARGTLERLVTLVEDFAPDEAVFNPQMMGVFASVTAKLRSTPGFDYEITTTPTAAAVIFDGRLVGLSPVAVRGVRKGKHFVSAVLKGYERSAKAVEVKAKGPRDVPLLLTPISKRDAGTVDLAVGAIEAMGSNDTPPEAKELLMLTRADTLLLLQVSPGSATVTTYSEGSERTTKSTGGEPVDLATARRMARDLLGSIAGGPSGPRNRSPSPVVAKNAPGDRGGTTADDEPPPPDMTKDASVPDRRAVTKAANTPPTTTFGGFQSGTAKLGIVLGLCGGAVALAATGGIFGLLAMSDQTEYNKTTIKGGKIVQDQTTDQLEGEAIAARGRHRALLADILYGSAGLVATAGVLVQVLWTPPPAPTGALAGEKSWTFIVGPGYGSLAIQF
jgi:hypothetical protein